MNPVNFLVTISRKKKKFIKCIRLSSSRCWALSFPFLFILSCSVFFFLSSSIAFGDTAVLLASMHGWEASPPGVDEPIRNLVQSQSRLLHQLSLFLICWVRVLQVCVEPAAQNVCHLPRQIAPSLLARRGQGLNRG